MNRKTNDFEKSIAALMKVYEEGDQDKIRRASDYLESVFRINATQQKQTEIALS